MKERFKKVERRSPDLGDEAYWRSFRDRVLEAAGPELARRRGQAQSQAPSIVEILFAWRRRLAPAAVGVAGAALLMVLALTEAVDRGSQVESPPVPPGVGLEDLLVGAAEVDGELDLRLQRLRGDGEMNVDEVFYAVESTP